MSSFIANRLFSRTRTLSCRARALTAVLALTVAPNVTSAQPATTQPAPLPSSAIARVARLLPATASVRLRRLGATRDTNAVAGQTLSPGDQLTATGTAALMELQCGGQRITLYRMQSPFTIVIDVPVDTICHVNIKSGRGDIIAEMPTVTTAGGVPLASRGTQYSVDVTGEGELIACQLAVFEGVVDVRRSGEAVPQGRSLTWARGTTARTVIGTRELDAAATVNARFDVYAARAAKPDIDTVATFAEMKRLQYDMLANPTDTRKRVDLAKRQIQIKSDEQAAYNLKRANVTTDSALRSYRIDPTLIESSATLRDRVYSRKPASTGASISATAAGSVTERASASGATAAAAAALSSPSTAASAGASTSAAASATTRATTSATAVSGTRARSASMSAGTVSVVSETIRALEARVSAGTATSRDHFDLANAYASRSAASQKTNAERAIAKNATDHKLTATEVAAMQAIVARTP